LVINIQTATKVQYIYIYIYIYIYKTEHLFHVDGVLRNSEDAYMLTETYQ